MTGSDLDEDVVALSVVEPDAFVAARNARAKELRAAKERDRAAAVAKLAKPTWTAWALNVLARDDPDEIAAWLAAGDALDAALADALSGDRDGLRGAQQAERGALARTIDRAGAVLTGAGRKDDDQARQRLTGTLRAAVTDAEVRDRLVRGVLADDVEAPSFGFGFAASDDNVVSMAAARSSRAAKGSKSPVRGAAGPGAAGRARTAGAGAAPDTADETAAEAARIEREETEAREAAAREEARRRAEAARAAELARLEAEVERRAEEVARLRVLADEAEAAASAARDAVAAADRALGDARSALADLPPVDPDGA